MHSKCSRQALHLTLDCPAWCTSGPHTHPPSAYDAEERLQMPRRACAHCEEAGESSQWDCGMFATSQRDVSKSCSGEGRHSKGPPSSFWIPPGVSALICRLQPRAEHWRNPSPVPNTCPRISATAPTSISLGVLPVEAFVHKKSVT